MYPARKWSFALMILVFVATWIKPNWPAEQALHSSLTIIGFAVLCWHIRRNGMAERDLFLIALFIATHSIAARWLYSYVPYDKWIQATLGFSLDHAMGWTRNHFDRLVHFLYGFCFTPAIVSYLTNKYRLSAKLGFYIAASAIMITSLWYEWFEWLIAITLSAKDAEAYNGQQGDPWDAHKDMLMATVGSVVWAKAYLALKYNKTAQATMEQARG